MDTKQPCDETTRFEGIPVEQLPGAFRAFAGDLEPYAAESVVTVFKQCALALERALSARMESEEVLSIRAAAEEWGWSYEALRRRVAGDEDLNAGGAGSPAIRRKDLHKLGPRKRRKVLSSASRLKGDDGAGAGSASTRFEGIKKRVQSAN